VRISRLIGVTAATAAAVFAVPAALGGGGAPGVLLGSNGVAAPGGLVRYVAFPAQGRTIIGAVRTNGGQVLRFRVLRGSYGIPVVASDGRTEGLTRDGKSLVLAPAVAPTARISRFAVLETRTLGVRQLVTLRGAFAYDALSPDGKTLYLIELLGGDGARYRVRASDLEKRTLLSRSISDPDATGKAMAGLPVTRATSGDGRWVYTLYARPGRSPFVHALDAKRRAAVCIDLPRRVADEEAFRLRLRLSRDGRRLTVGRGGDAEAVIDTATFRARRA
jgi:hypothetical protein